MNRILVSNLYFKMEVVHTLNLTPSYLGVYCKLSELLPFAFLGDLFIYL